AIATACAQQRRSVILIEQHPQFGAETSSRNSEVIHSGIYYPVNSLKTRFCVQGRQDLYRFCADRNIAHLKTGKFVIATNDDEIAYLDKLSNHAKSLNVPVERV